MRRYPNANLDGPDSPVAKWKTAKVQVSGEVHAHRVEQTDDAERWTDPRGVPHTTFGRRAVAQVAVTIEAIESERSNVFDRVRYDEQVAAETQAVDCEPAAIDHDALLANARRRVVDRYLRRVMPHVDYVVVHLFVDGDLPGLEVGNGFARTGDWPAALDSYRTAAEMATGDLAEVRYKALHNVGVASLYTDDFEAARRALKEAYALGREPASLRQLEMVAQREQELEQLRQRNERAAEPAR
jgi:tetratricopeptide (TPR) repeat protein